MSAAEAEMRTRDAVNVLARTDFLTFLTRAFHELEGHQLDYNWHIAAIAACAMEIESGAERRLIVCMPPRYLKSFILTVALPAWSLGRNPRAKIMCCSYSGDLAEKFSSDTLRLMRSDWYRRVFPNTYINPNKATKTEIETTVGGSRFASSVGGTLTGRGADLIVVDDPLKANDAHSEANREASISWFNNSVRSRLNNPSKGRMIVVAQRLHAEDLPGHLLESATWRSLIIPAIQWQDSYYDLGPDYNQVLLRAGRALQEDRQSLTDLAELRREMGERDFEAQYNQRPLPPGGATFKAEWLRRYESPPPRSKIEGIVQSWDTAYEDSESSDYSVCTTWALCPDGFYLLDVWRGRPRFFELERQVYELRKHWRANIVIIEKAASGISLLQNIRERDRHMWLMNVSPESSKISRAHQQTPKFEQGRVWLPKAAAWLEAYEKELLSFPQVKHDDQVDATVQLLMAHDAGQLISAIRNYGHL